MKFITLICLGLILQACALNPVRNTYDPELDLYKATLTVHPNQN